MSSDVVHPLYPTVLRLHSCTAQPHTHVARPCALAFIGRISTASPLRPRTPCMSAAQGERQRQVQQLTRAFQRSCEWLTPPCASAVRPPCDRATTTTSTRLALTLTPPRTWALTKLGARAGWEGGWGVRCSRVTCHKHLKECLRWLVQLSVASMRPAALSYMRCSAVVAARNACGVAGPRWRQTRRTACLTWACLMRWSVK